MLHDNVKSICEENGIPISKLFDDCWRAIGQLHFVIIVLAAFVFWNRRR